MFDVGFSELVVIGIVALVVIGPERLPKVARTAGHLLGRLQRYVSDVKADISREMQLEEMKKLQAEVQESARSFERSIAGEIRAVEQGVNDTVASIRNGVEDSAPASGTTVAAAGTTTAIEEKPAAADSDPAAPAAKG